MTKVYVRGKRKEHGVAVAQLAQKWRNVGIPFKRGLGDGGLEGPLATKVEMRCNGYERRGSSFGSELVYSCWEE